MLQEEKFQLDFLMTNMSYTHEWGNTGWIYMQIFPNEKMYAGQTINITSRFQDYGKGRGNNPHHTNALKLYGWNAIRKITTKVPRFLLDRVEIFFIEYYDLTNKTNGYNKTTGGNRNYRLSKDTRNTISMSHKKLWEDENYRKSRCGRPVSEETRDKCRQVNLGKILSEETKKRISTSKKGTIISQTTRDKISKSQKGKIVSKETKKRMSLNNNRAQPMYAFGKLYRSVEEASNGVRREQNIILKNNFIKKWANQEKHKKYVFKISREFYETHKDHSDISKNMYDDWVYQQTLR